MPDSRTLQFFRGCRGGVAAWLKCGAPGRGKTKWYKGRNQITPMEGAESRRLGRSTPGRIGAEARFWILEQVRHLPDDMQARELDRAYRLINCCVQGYIALQLRRAAGLR